MRRQSSWSIFCCILSVAPLPHPLAKLSSILHEVMPMGFIFWHQLFVYILFGLLLLTSHNLETTVGLLLDNFFHSISEYSSTTIESRTLGVSLYIRITPCKCSLGRVSRPLCLTSSAYAGDIFFKVSFTISMNCCLAKEIDFIGSVL